MPLCVLVVNLWVMCMHHVATWVFKQKVPKRKAACKRTNLTSNRFDLWFISHTCWLIKCNFEGNPRVWVYIHGVCNYVFPKQHT